MSEPLADFLTRAAAVRASLSGRRLVIYDETVARVSPESVRRFQARHGTRLATFVPDGPEKYGDIPLSIAGHTKEAVLLDLDQRAVTQVLDIGSGGGAFLAIAEALGHRAIGIDLDDPFFADLCAVMAVDRRISPVRPQQRLPDFGTRFDLITIVLQKFDHLATHRDGSRDYWSIDDWSFFLSDLRERQLNCGGAIYLRLNTEKQKGAEACNPDLLRYCAQLGARIEGRTIILK